MTINTLLEKYDIFYTNPDGNSLGFMLAKTKGDVKVWSRQDQRGLPDSFAPGDISYANISPEIAKVIAQEYLHGGLGTLKHESSEDEAFTKLRYLRSQDIDLRCKGKAYPGPKITAPTNPTSSATEWLSPTSDSGDWTNPEKAWDEDEGTPAYKLTAPGWSTWITLIRLVPNCSKIRFYAPTVGGTITAMQLEAYYDGGWQPLYNAAFADMTWVEVNISPAKSVSQCRLKFYNDTTETNVFLYELDFEGEDGTVGAVSAQAVFNDKLYVAFGEVLAKLNGDGTAFTEVETFPNAITALEVFGDFLYIAMGASNKYFYMNTSDVFLESDLTDGEADQFCKVGSQLYQMKLPNRIRKSTGGNPTNSGSWDGETTVGETVYNINDLVAYASVLYCLKEDGPYYIEIGVGVLQPFPELASIAHADSGKNSVVAFNKLYFRMGNQQVFEISGSTLTEVTPSSFSQGISQYTYACVAFAQDEAWLYALMYRGNNDVALLAGRWEYLAGQTRWVWHDIRKLTGITNASGALVSSIEGRPYLYIGSTVAGETVQKLYLPTVNDATADSGYRFATSGSLWTPRYTTLLTAIDKRWVELFARSKNLTGNNYITVTQSVDDGGNFNALGVLNDSPEKTLVYSSIESAMMNLLFVFTGDSEAVPPVLLDFNLKAITLMPSVVTFSHAVKCDDLSLLKKNIRSKVTQAEIITFVDSLRDNICTLGDPWGNEHTVRVRVIGEKVVFDEDKQKPPLIYSIEATKI